MLLTYYTCTCGTCFKIQHLKTVKLEEFFNEHKKCLCNQITSYYKQADSVG